MIDTVVDYGTREAWLKARLSGIGASESAALFGLSPYHGRLSLWLEKTGRVPQWEPSGDDAERLEWGQLLEAPIATAYERRTQRKLWAFSPFCMARHPQHGVMFATPDRFIIEAPDRGREGLSQEGSLQVKNTANMWSEEGWGGGMVPQHVQVQVQHELACTGREYGAVATLANGNKLMMWDIERNDEFIDELEIQCEMFWEDVLAGRQPKADGHPRTREALKRLHPLDNGQTVDLGPDAMAVWDDLIGVRQVLRNAEKRKDELEAQLAVAIGANTFGLLPDGRTVSYKTTTRAGYVVEQCTFRSFKEITASAASAAPRKKGKAA